jgi:hypothetical protein
MRSPKQKAEGDEEEEEEEEDHAPLHKKAPGTMKEVEDTSHDSMDVELPAPLMPTRSAPLRPSQAVHDEGGSGASSGTPRDNRSRFGAPNIRCKRMPALLRAHPQRKLAHTALEVDRFSMWSFSSRPVP